MNKLTWLCVWLSPVIIIGALGWLRTHDDVATVLSVTAFAIIGLVFVVHVFRQELWPALCSFGNWLGRP